MPYLTKRPWPQKRDLSELLAITCHHRYGRTHIKCVESKMLIFRVLGYSVLSIAPHSIRLGIEETLAAKATPAEEVSTAVRLPVQLN